MKRTAMNTLVISNVDVGDEVFESLSHGNWNVTRAARDCADGKHRKFVFNVADVACAAADTEVDPAKVDSMVADPVRLLKAPPSIFVNLNQILWLIDGLHRIRALHRLGAHVSVGYAIEGKDAGRYRVTYNGQPTAPWQKQQ